MDEHETLDEWLNRITRSHRTHNFASSKYARLSRLLGITAAVLSAVVGTSVFVTLEASPNLYLKILAGLLSIAAAVMGCLHTLLGYSELAGRHKVAAARYGELRSRLEAIKAFPPASEIAQRIELFRTEWNKVSQEAPIISQELYDEQERKYTKEKEAERKNKEEREGST